MSFLAEKFCIGIILCLTALPSAADYPERPFQIIVEPFTGEAESLLSEMLADQIEKRLELPAAVLEMDASKLSQHMFRASADGYTIGTLTNSVAIVDVVQGKVNYSATTFEPLGIFLEYPTVLLTKTDMPFHNLKGLTRHAKAVPLTLAHSGHNQIATKQMTTLAKTLGFNFEDGGVFPTPECNLLSNGAADVIVTTPELAVACIRQGNAKAIVTMSRDRLAALPDTPTINEHFPEIALSAWSGLFVKTGTPTLATRTLKEIATSILESGDFIEKAEDSGVLITIMDEDEGVMFRDEQYARTTTVFTQ